jgi:hypothetical protein
VPAADSDDQQTGANATGKDRRYKVGRRVARDGAGDADRRKAQE